MRMRATSLFARVSRGALLIAACAVAALSQNAPPPASRTAAPPANTAAPPSSQSGYALKVKTRLVTLDVLVTDAGGKFVRDLKPEDLQLLVGTSSQKIAHFDVVDASAAPAKLADSAAPAKDLYSNRFSFEHLAVPPTVILMDALNTSVPGQMQARQQMVKLLPTLPADTPVAVFLLGDRLTLLRGFTSNPALLRAAANKVLGPSAGGQNALGDQARQDTQDLEDPDSPTNLLGSMGTSEDVAQAIEDFEKEDYADSVDLRARVTLDSLTDIARYLSGIPGRKNLLWLSESFPFSITPDTTTGGDPFSGNRAYEPQVKAASNALVDAQVALYPVDVRGVQALQSASASQMGAIQPPAPRGRGQAPDGGVSARETREQGQLIQSQGTMDALANDTGGKACKNTNDLSRCVRDALDDGASYYEISFYPDGIPWDNQFHKITLKTTRRNIKLSYRSGYFAVDSDALVSAPPADRLRQACADLLPSTAIPILVQALPTTEPPALRYGLLMPADLVGVPAPAPAAGNGTTQIQLHIQYAACAYGAKTGPTAGALEDVSQDVTDDMAKAWQAQGIPIVLNVDPSPNLQRIRFVILDMISGLTGAVDVPVTAAQITAAANAPIPQAVPIVDIPDREAAPAQPKPQSALVFHAGAQSGSLDWNGDALIYKGDLPVSQAAAGFFSYALGAKFVCRAGALVSQAADGPAPQLQFLFRNHNNRIAIVNLQGAQPDYRGDLPVDPTAEAFFAALTPLAHCQAK